MGVVGITKFLEEQNLLPTTASNECCSSALWKDWNPSMAFRGEGPTLETLAPKSKILIDGNGLAFYLYQVAYARYVQAQFSDHRRRHGSCPKVKTLSSGEIAQSLPFMLPLEYVRQTTTEFVKSLKQKDLTLKCFWDGASPSAFKAKTLERRWLQRKQAWAALQTYCKHGSLPMKGKDTVCSCFSHFPVSKLFTLSVQQALRSCSMEMIRCKGEADVEIAIQASGDPNCYVMGQDSDFIFYKDIQYIPFGGIYMPSSQGQVRVVALRRSEIAENLGLEDLEMVELAILLGNDYVDAKSLKNGPITKKNVADRIAFLQETDGNFQAQSKDELADREIEYVRSLYNLENLDQFSEADDDYSTASASLATPLDELEESIISFPSDFSFNQACLLPTDSSVCDAIRRCLQSYVDQCDGADDVEPLLLLQHHVDAYEKATANPFSSRTTMVKLESRPRWKDTCAAFIIETCISQMFRSTGGSGAFLVQLTPPDSLMNHLQFHESIFSIQSENCNTGSCQPDNEDTNSLAEPDIENRPVLPIDEHEDNILKNIETNRVTIIHGETGCGKSSRVPVMILETPSPEPSLPKVKMFISQPRRIAAASLVKRVRACEPKHRDKFALRMGHGHREFESNKTQAWFVTTGYLTRLLANHPERFNDVTHLIIDEVHERSVDTDILCLLCRRLLENNPNIRLVLMSATLATKLYQDYFNVPNEPIHVGVRRFPIQEFFVEDLHSNFQLPPNELTATKAIQRECESKRCNQPPSSQELSKRFSLAARLATIVGDPGSSVLIFVPGMAEIVAITEAIEKFFTPGVEYLCYPIHSDIPFEDQMDAFTLPGPNEVKVIIATNAAESSVTLPAVDHVICLGLCRQIMYNQASHRQILMPCWISKASATQRAGRTGRVRPGKVYRLYTRHAYDHYMAEFEQGEMVRIPLDNVILMLKEMLHGEVKPVLMNTIEPPKIETIDKSFESLYQWSFLSAPDDSAEITNLGCFVSALGVDLALGYFIGLGIQFGVAAEAIEMAAVMSFPKTPFQISNPLIHSPSKYNTTVAEAYAAKCHFDANLYSEALGLMNALWDYHASSDKDRWCTFYRFSHARMRQLHSTRNSLRQRVADFLGIHENKLQVQSPPVHMHHAKVTILRILKVWVFSDAIVECKPPKISRQADDSVIISVPSKQLHGNAISEELLDQILMKNRHHYQIVENRKVDGRGEFQPLKSFELSKGIDGLQERLMSYMCTTNLEVTVMQDKSDFYFFMRDDSTEDSKLKSLFEVYGSIGEVHVFQAEHKKKNNRRGIQGRKCGLWSVAKASEEESPSAPLDLEVDRRIFRRLHLTGGMALDETIFSAADIGDLSSMFSIEFTESKKKKKQGKKQETKSSNQAFSYSLRGACRDITKLDMQDLLAAKSVQLSKIKGSSGKHILFPACDSKPIHFTGKGADLLATSVTSEWSSWSRPLFQDIPEGARLISVLASGQRKRQLFLRFPCKEDEGKDEEESSIDIMLVPDQVNIGSRWRRIGSDTTVFVPTDVVPASATCLESPLFACCATALDLHGGGLRVEGLTLLPPNPLFLLLCRLAFGLSPDVSLSFGSMSQKYGNEEANKVSKSLQWLKQYTKSASNNSLFSRMSIDSKERIEKAIEFHESCDSMGEKLAFFPEQTKKFCEIFCGVDGYDVRMDESIEEQALSERNLAAWREEKKAIRREPSPQTPTQTSHAPLAGKKRKQKVTALSSKSKEEKAITPASSIAEPNRKPKPRSNWRILRVFDEATKGVAKRLFATGLGNDEQSSQTDFPSTNILSLLVHHFSETLVRNGLAESVSDELRNIQLDANHWEIVEHKDEGGKAYYDAKFVNTLLPVIPICGRGKNNLPKWMKKHMRPRKVEDYQACVPPTVTLPEPKMLHLSKDRPVLAFASIEDALRMEAAFYLERQFAVAGKVSTRHWYHHQMDEMVQILWHNHEKQQLSPL